MTIKSVEFIDILVLKSLSRELLNKMCNTNVGSRRYLKDLLSGTVLIVKPEVSSYPASSPGNLT